MHCAFTSDNFCSNVESLKFLTSGGYDQMFTITMIFFIGSLLAFEYLDKVSVRKAVLYSVLIGSTQDIVFLPLAMLPVYAFGISFQSNFMMIGPALLVCLPFIMLKALSKSAAKC
ncbi:hypothetical protein PRUB_a3337 [Pseudoalteromonas rubra]|uniref:Uncharacterized protein n=2 Tax=Pseudoalteromonas rubra TaxID=43658 RepID=A0A8T0C4E2_9GAMM|nr:hypothetical protein PRUB_a3337 [Pseudoalteromonas rubra]